MPIECALYMKNGIYIIRAGSNSRLLSPFRDYPAVKRTQLHIRNAPFMSARCGTYAERLKDRTSAQRQRANPELLLELPDFCGGNDQSSGSLLKRPQLDNLRIRQETIVASISQPGTNVIWLKIHSAHGSASTLNSAPLILRPRRSRGDIGGILSSQRRCRLHPESAKRWHRVAKGNR